MTITSPPRTHEPSRPRARARRSWVRADSRPPSKRLKAPIKRKKRRRTLGLTPAKDWSRVEEFMSQIRLDEASRWEESRLRSES